MEGHKDMVARRFDGKGFIRSCMQVKVPRTDGEQTTNHYQEKRKHIFFVVLF